ncbi:MAG: response regulator [bacterium]|nr:response regulator [bacterium]
MNPPKALFVDDEPFVLKALRRIFMDDNLDIGFACNGEEALQYLQETEVDVILSDHNMPGLTGVEFLAKAKEIQPDAIRMLITGRGDMELALKAINEGSIYKFFCKPWEDDDLRISILRSLEFKQVQAQLRDQQEKLARFESYSQTIITVSHYINNFNCALMMSVENLKTSPNLTPFERNLAATSFKASEKIREVLRILNRLQDIKVTDYPFSEGIIDIDAQMKAAIDEIDGR